MADGDSYAIEVAQLSKSYGPAAVLDDVTFGARSGSVTGLRGPTGAGKTTVLSCLLGLAEPASGSATVFGKPFGEHQDAASVMGSNLGLGGAHPKRSGRAHLRALAAMAGLPAARADDELELVGIDAELADRRYGTYPADARQRLALAAAMFADPEVLVLDDPTAGLERSGVDWLSGLLRDLASEGWTILIAGRTLEEASGVLDEVVSLDRGRIVEQS